MSTSGWAFPTPSCSTARPRPPPSPRPGGWRVELDQYFSDPSSLSDPALVDAIVGYERLAAWAQARQARLIAELASRRAEPGSVTDWAADEVATALHQSTGTAAFRTRQATALIERLPGTLAAWEAGLLDQRRVTTITQGTVNLTAEHAALVEARVLPEAPSQTAAQLQAAIKRAIISVDPDGAEERHEAARKGRRVAVNPEDDGMASLWALLPAPDAIAAYEWLTRLARGCGADDPRTMDERRADLARRPAQRPVAQPRPGPADAGEPGQTAGQCADADDRTVRAHRRPERTARLRPDHRRRWPARSPPPRPGGGCCSTRSPGRCSTTAAPPTPHPSRWPISSRPGMCTAGSRAAAARWSTANSTTSCAYAEGGPTSDDQPGRVLRPPPPPQTRRRRLAGPRPARRRAGVDHPDRASARHPALRLPRRPRPTLNPSLPWKSVVRAARDPRTRFRAVTS